MRYRFTGAVVAMTLAAAVSLTVAPTAQQGRGNAPAAPAAGQGRGQAARPAQIAGHPNLNGVWQAMGTAHWNLEDHSAAATPFWQLGAMFAIPAGQSVVVGGTIPYLPAGLKKREENMKGWPKSDPEAKCYMAGIPRSTYMPYPFQIVQGQKDILFVYEYASSNRIVHMDKPSEAPVDSWMGWSNGKWDGNTLVIEVTGNNDQTWFDRAGNHHTEALKVTERYYVDGRQPHPVRSHDRGSEDVLEAVADSDAALSPDGAERAAARIQVRGVLRRAALRGSEEEDRVVLSNSAAE